MAIVIKSPEKFFILGPLSTLRPEPTMVDLENPYFKLNAPQCPKIFFQAPYRLFLRADNGTY
jgi:hypothetical protein